MKHNNKLSKILMTTLLFNLGCKPRLDGGSDTKGVGRAPASVDPINTEEDLKEFLKKQNLFTNVNSVPDQTSALEELQGVRDTIPGDNPKLLAAFDRYMRFRESVGVYSNGPNSLAHTGKDGKPITNTDYLSSVMTLVKLPNWLNSPTFLKNITADGSRDLDLKSDLQKANAQEGRSGKTKALFIRFAENRLGSGDPSDGKDRADRSLFFIPSRNPKDMDYAVMFSGLNTTSVVAIDHSSGQPQTLYLDHTWSPAGGIVALSAPPFTNACTICHKSGGFFPVHPDMNKSHDSESLANIKIFNKFIEGTGVAHHQVYDQIENKFDPNLPSLDRSDLGLPRIKELLSNNKIIVPQAVNLESFTAKVSSTQTCGECHSEDRDEITTMGYKMRNALRPPMFSPFGMVALGLMPPDNKFNQPESELFARLLEADYRDKLINYFVAGPVPKE